MCPEGQGDIRGINFFVWADNNWFSEGSGLERVLLPTGCVSQRAPVLPRELHCGCEPAAPAA